MFTNADGSTLAAGFPVVETRSTFNLFDTGDPLTGDGEFKAGQRAPGLVATGDNDDYVVVGSGVLTVTEAEAGPVTFRSIADDGARLRIDLNGDGDFDEASELIFVDERLSEPRVMETTLHLTAGQYRIQYATFERELGAEAELSASLNNRAFRLVGDADGGGLALLPQYTSATAALQINTAPIDPPPFSFDSSRPVVAADAAGNFVTAWQAYGADGDGWGIFARRYDAGGHPLDDPFRVNTTAFMHQANPAVAMEPDGDFVVAWQSDVDFMFQRFTADGLTAGAETKANTFSFGQLVWGSKYVTYAPAGTISIGISATGHFTMAWDAGTFGGRAPVAVYARRFDAAGLPLGGEFLISDPTVRADQPEVAMNASGDTVIVYRTAAEQVPHLIARLYDSTGTARSGRINVSTASDTPRYGDTGPGVTMGASGNFVVAWFSDRKGTQAAIRRFDAAGSPLGPTFLANSYTYLHPGARPLVTLMENGELLVAWDGQLQGMPINDPGRGVYARRISSADVPIGDEFLVQASSPGTAMGAQRVTGTTIGSGFVVLWDTFGERDVYARLYSVDPPPSGVVVRAGEYLNLATAQSFDSLTIEDDAIVTLEPASNVVLQLGALHINEGGCLDLGDNELIIQAAPEGKQELLETLTAWIRSARDGVHDRWSGTGITSSVARANPMNGLIIIAGPTAVDGGHRSIAADEILIKYTYNGDANLDGLINADDYFRIDSGFLAQPPSPAFTQGDFNYDGKINADDYFLIDQAFLGQGASLAGEVPVASTTTASVVAASVPVEAQERVVRKRAVRPLFSDEPVLATRTARRTSGARQRGIETRS